MNAMLPPSFSVWSTLRYHILLFIGILLRNSEITYFGKSFSCFPEKIVLSEIQILISSKETLSSLQCS